MMVDTPGKPEPKKEKYEEDIDQSEQDSGTKGGQSSDFKTEEENMGGQDAGNMNNPQTDEE